MTLRLSNLEEATLKANLKAILKANLKATLKEREVEAALARMTGEVIRIQVIRERTKPPKKMLSLFRTRSD